MADDSIARPLRHLDWIHINFGPSLLRCYLLRFTQVMASLVERGVVNVSRINQDGVRVRVGAGAANFRREERLQKLLEECRRACRGFTEATGGASCLEENKRKYPKIEQRQIFSRI